MPGGMSRDRTSKPAVGMLRGRSASPNLENVVFKVFGGDGGGGPVHVHFVLAVACRVVAPRF